MPQPELSSLFDSCVVWPAIGIDRFGQSLVGEPYEIDGTYGRGCRWNDMDAETNTPEKETTGYAAEVIVTVDIPMYSRMWKGTLDEWYGPVGTGSGSGSGAEEDRLMEVKNIEYTRDIKGRVAFRCVNLMRYKGTN